jgi:hypothetical protein
MASRSSLHSRAARRRAREAADTAAPAPSGVAVLERAATPPEVDGGPLTRVVDPATVASRDAARGLRRDMKVLLGLRHTNLLSAVAFDPKAHTVTYEAVRGVTLRRLVDERGALRLDAAMVVYDDCLAGLEALHIVEVEHGSVDTDGLLVETSGAVMVSNACILHPRGPGRTVAADLHAAAVVFHVAATGRRPHPAAAARHQRGRRPGPMSAGPVMPAGAGMVLQRALDPDVSVRPATAADSRRDLAEAATSFVGSGWRKSGRAWLAEAATALAPEMAVPAAPPPLGAGEGLAALDAAALTSPPPPGDQTPPAPGTEAPALRGPVLPSTLSLRVPGASSFVPILDAVHETRDGATTSQDASGRFVPSLAPAATTGAGGGGFGFFDPMRLRFSEPGRRGLTVAAIAACLVVLVGTLVAFQLTRPGTPEGSPGGVLALTNAGTTPGPLTGNGPGAVGSAVTPPPPPPVAPNGTPLPVIGANLTSPAARATPGPSPKSTPGPTHTPSPPGSPGAPGTPSVVLVGATSLSVSFVDNTSNGSPITQYTVSPFDNTAGVRGTQVTGPSSPIMVGGLAYGHSYTVTVTATNGVGTGSPSTPSSAVTIPAVAPGAPSSVSATGGDGQATVTFGAAAANGSPISRYTATAVDHTTGTNGPALSNSGSPINFTGLTNGHSYSFSVVATNGVGPGPAAVSNAVTPAGPPGPPANAAANNLTAGQITVSWSQAFPNGSPITDYTVTVTHNGATSPPQSVGASTTSWTLTGTTAGDLYQFTITAMNGVGSASTSVQATGQ